MYTYKLWKTNTEHGWRYCLKIYDASGDLVFGDCSYGFSYLKVMASDFDINITVEDCEE